MLDGESQVTAYNQNPSQFYINPDGTVNPGIDFLLEPQGNPTFPNHTYMNKPVFPVKKLEGKIFISALLVAGNFGIPMRGPHDQSENYTRFIAPGSTKTLNVTFSIPNGFKPYKILIPDVFESELDELTVE
jgi:hypothetical protein